MAERFVFFASAGFCLVMALLLEKIALPGDNRELFRNKRLMGVLVTVSIIYACLTIIRNNEWSDNMTLFSADIKKAPGSARLQQLLGLEILKCSDEEKDLATQKQMRLDGIKHVGTAVVICPGFAEAHSTLGKAYADIGMVDSAEIHLTRALQINPSDYNAMNSLAGVFFARKQYMQSIEWCKKSVAINPGIARTFANLGFSYIRMGQFAGAIGSLKKAADLDPSFPSIFRYIALSYKELNEPDSVLKYTELAQKMVTP